MQLGHGRIEGDRDLVAGDAAGGGDGVDQQVERLAVRAEPGREAALVADGGAVAAGGEQLAQGVVDLRGPAQALAEAVRAERHDHELLEVGGAGGVRAAVEQVRQRHGQRARLGIAVEAAEVAEEREPERTRGGVGRGERDAEDRVRAERALVGAAVGGDQRLVDGPLVARVEAAHRLGERPVDVGDGLLDAATAVAVGIAVAQLDGLVRAGAGAAGDDRPPERAAREDDVGLDGGVAARVEHLARAHVPDGSRRLVARCAGAHAVSLTRAVSGRGGWTCS